MLSIICSYDGVIAGTESYNKNILKKAKKLKVISRLGVGTDNIDMETSKEKNIEVLISQTTPGPAVAELSLGLMLDLYRKISYQNYNLKNNIWSKQMGNLLFKKTLGVIGLGTIGQTFVRLTKGFNFRILAYDINQDDLFPNYIIYLMFPLKNCYRNQILYRFI